MTVGYLYRDERTRGRANELYSRATDASRDEPECCLVCRPNALGHTQRYLEAPGRPRRPKLQVPVPLSALSGAYRFWHTPGIDLRYQTTAHEVSELEQVEGAFSEIATRLLVRTIRTNMERQHNIASPADKYGASDIAGARAWPTLPATAASISCVPPPKPSKGRLKSHFLDFARGAPCGGSEEPCLGSCGRCSSAPSAGRILGRLRGRGTRAASS